jgi:hypothetical protein
MLEFAVYLGIFLFESQTVLVFDDTKTSDTFRPVMLATTSGTFPFSQEQYLLSDVCRAIFTVARQVECT